MNQEFLTIEDVMKRYKISRSSIYRWINNGEFPEPVKLGKTLSRWKLSALNKWEEHELIEENG